MATKAYILIETAVGKTREVAQQLRKVPGMKSVDVVTGPYDVIALIEARDIASIGEMVTEHVHFGGVNRTVTCISVSGT
jgi:DNA-binding Lrp family transcriptional regulator